MEHTKGKWEVVLPKNPDLRQIEDRLICVRVGDEKIHIAEVFQYQNHKHREANGVAIANAKLIAASPLLYEACEEAFKALDTYEPCVAEKARILLKKAIAAATH